MRKTELLQTQVSNNEIREESEEITTFEEIKGTPFTGIYRHNKWIIVMGDEIASPKEFENVEEMKEYIDTKPWSLLMVSAAIFNKITNKKIKENEK